MLFFFFFENSFKWFCCNGISNRTRRVGCFGLGFRIDKL